MMRVYSSTENGRKENEKVKKKTTMGHLHVFFEHFSYLIYNDEYYINSDQEKKAYLYLFLSNTFRHFEFIFHSEK